MVIMHAVMTVLERNRETPKPDKMASNSSRKPAPYSAHGTSEIIEAGALKYLLKMPDAQALLNAAAV